MRLTLDLNFRVLSPLFLAGAEQARPELPLQVILNGRYHDRLARSGGAWHFTDRLILIDLIGDLRFHLKRDPFAG